MRKAFTVSLLYLVRHGQASFGQAEYDRLSDLGRKQARITGAHLRALGVRLDAAYCGTMSRQIDTAGAVLEALGEPVPLLTDPVFNEYDSGPIIKALLPALAAEDQTVALAAPDMFKDRRAFQIIYEGAMLRWIAGTHDVGSAETWRGFLARVDRAVARVKAENGRGRTVAVFTSGGPIAAVLRLALGLADETALRLTWVIKNASLSSLLFDQDRLTLSLFNCTAHLEQRREDGLITYR